MKEKKMSEQDLLFVFNSELNYTSNQNHSYALGYMSSLMKELISVPGVAEVIEKEVVYLKRLNSVHNQTRQPR
jgi:hypothetical protein